MARAGYAVAALASLLALIGSPQVAAVNQTAAATECGSRARSISGVEFFSLSENENVVRLRLSCPEGLVVPLCRAGGGGSQAPESAAEANAVNLVGHVFCRQMGFMTSTGRKWTRAGGQQQRPGWLPATAVLCSGAEQKLQHCRLLSANQVATTTTTANQGEAGCREVLAVQCGSCSHTSGHLEDGWLASPGFPVSLAYTLQCDWLLYTQLGQGFELTFQQFRLPSAQLTPVHSLGASNCLASNAFLEIWPHGGSHQGDGDQDQEQEVLGNGRRFCVFREPDKRMRIRSKALLIHFSSGIRLTDFFLAPSQSASSSQSASASSEDPVATDPAASPASASSATATGGNFVRGFKLHFKAINDFPEEDEDQREGDEEEEDAAERPEERAANVSRRDAAVEETGGGKPGTPLPVLLLAATGLLLLVAALGAILALAFCRWRQAASAASATRPRAKKVVRSHRKPDRADREQEQEEEEDKYEEIALPAPRVPPRTFPLPPPRSTFGASRRESCSSGISVGSTAAAATNPQQQQQQYMQLVCSGHCQYVPFEELNGRAQPPRTARPAKFESSV
ncbi:hypothetical protein HDE_11545 [Halotydeus destructor]|nr:hypothetical protein HDE_11545 [Halotydeus destructor]